MMTAHNFLSCGPYGTHRIAYTEWGDPDNNHIVICVHGLTRNSRDFDFFAAAMETHCRVICVDVAGRGLSDWLSHAESYDYPVYMRDAEALINNVAADNAYFTRLWRQFFGGKNKITIDWVGTSMGGLIGMLIAALPFTPLRRLVLNDIGPFIPAAALKRIGTYLGRDLRFPSLDALEKHLREIAAPFGPLTDAQWRHLAVYSARQYDDGSYGFRYDPKIAVPFQNAQLSDVDLWPVWKRITCPTLLLRGAESDLLLAETVDEMQKCGPHSQFVEFPGIGHAPMLMADDQISVVRDFILRPE